MCKEFGPVSGVLRPDALRHKDFDRLPDQFSPFVAEQLIDLLIRHENGAAFIYQQHPARRGFNDDSELFFRMLAFGEIAYDRSKTGRLPVISHHRKHGDGHRDLGTILPEIVDFIIDRLAGLEDLSHDAIPLFLVSFGDQVLNIHPEQLFSRKAGQLGKCSIDEEDGSIECGITDRVLRCFDNISKEFLIRFHFSFGPLSIDNASGEAALPLDGAYETAASTEHF
jgi:hypothetical protein